MLFEPRRRVIGEGLTMVRYRRRLLRAVPPFDNGAVRSWLVLLLFSLAVPAGFSQTVSYPYSVFGQIGGAKVYDDEGSLGSGLYAGGGVGYRFHRRFEVEGEISRFSHERSIGGGAFKFAGTGTFGAGNLLFFFKSGRAQPYLLGGVGLLHYNNRSTLSALPEASSTGFAGSAGFGVLAFLTPRVSLRPEVRVSMGGGTLFSGVEPPLAVLRYSVTIGYHWGGR
jgi:hypothetical protein